MPTVRKSDARAIADHAPWKAAKYETADIAAIKALSEGRATIQQQKRAFAWIVEKASNYYDLSYRPGGPEGVRDTDFAEGRRFVGAQLVKLTKLRTSEEE